MDELADREQPAEGAPEASTFIHQTSLRGIVVQPFWAFATVWSALCGALASNRLLWSGGGLFDLTLVFLLVAVGWAGLWLLTTDPRWFQLSTVGRTLHLPVVLPTLPYTRPHSPAGQFGRALSRLVNWWRGIFWPAMGTALVGVLLAALLTAVLSVLLPDRLRWLNAAVIALCGLGVVLRWRGNNPQALLAFWAVGLSWLAGHQALAGLSWPSLVLAFLFSVAVMGVLRMGESWPGGVWLLDGGQAAAGVVLVVLMKPLAAGVNGLLLFAQIALQLSLRFGGDPVQVARRTWPWLFVAMLVAAWAIP